MKSHIQHARQVCPRKVRFDTEEEAQQFARGSCEPYKCRLCNGWHNGHRKLQDQPGASTKVNRRKRYKQYKEGYEAPANATNPYVTAGINKAKFWQEGFDTKKANKQLMTLSQFIAPRKVA